MHNFVMELSKPGMLLPTLLLFFMAAHSAGWLISEKILTVKWRHPVPALLVNLTLGMDFMALLTLIAGSLKILSPATIWWMLAIMSIPCLWRLKILFKTAGAYIRRNRTFTVIICILMVYASGSALCLPYCWDELTYHVALPLRWIQTNSVMVFLDNPYSAFPSLPHLLFRLTMETGGIKMPRALCLAAYLIFFIAAYWSINSYGSRWKILLCFATFTLSPVFITMMREAYVEPFMLINLAAAVMTLRGTAVSGTTKPPNVLLLCGILAGGAAAVKLTGLGVAAVIFILTMTYVWNDSKSRLAHSLIAWSLGAVFFVLPFYLRPFWYTGNPFYPFLAGIFTADQRVLAVSKFHYAMGYSHFGVMDLGGFFISPALLCWFGKLFDGIVLGWQFLAFGILAVWLAAKTWQAGQHWKKHGLIIAILFFYLFWFFTSQQSRFILPLYFLIMLAGAHAFCRLVSVRALVLWTLLLAGSAGINLDWKEFRHYYLAWKWVFGNPSGVQKYLEAGTRDKGFVRAMTTIAEQTPQQARIMLIFERRGLYMARPYVIATPFYQERFFTPLPANGEAVMQVLQREKIDYILVGASLMNPDHLEEYNEAYMRLGQLLAHLKVSKKLEDVWFDDCYGLYKVIRGAQ